MPVLGGHFVNFFHGFKSWELYASFFSRLQGEQNVFVHEPQGKIGSEVALQDEWPLIIDDAGADHGSFDKREQLLRIDSELGGESKRLGEAFKDLSDLEVHGQLGSLAFAGFTHAKNFLAHGCEQGVEAIDDRFVSP